MNPFPLVNGQVQLSELTPLATDVARSGMLLAADDTAVRAFKAGGVVSAAGLTYTAAGQLLYVDATAGLPAGTTYVNGLPVSPSGALCAAMSPPVIYSNGVPLAANGAVSIGATLGPELVPNSDFSQGDTGWTLGTNWAVTDGKLVATVAPAGSTTMSAAPVVEAGKTYAVSITSDSYTAGGWKLLLEGGTNVVGDQATAGTFTAVITAPMSGHIYVWANSDLTASFTNVSFREVL